VTYSTQYFRLFPHIVPTSYFGPRAGANLKELPGYGKLAFSPTQLRYYCSNVDLPSPSPSPPNDDPLIFPLQWHLVDPLGLGVDHTSLCLSLKLRGEIVSSSYNRRVTCFVRVSVLDGRPLGYKQERTGVVLKTQWNYL
jgi:hypothetical protein